MSTLPFFQADEHGTLWEHVRRALAVIEKTRHSGDLPRRVRARRLERFPATGGPGDGRERLCSAWTVTLHVQVMTTLARGLRAPSPVRRRAAALEQRVEAVRQDFQKLLIADGVADRLRALRRRRPGLRHLLHPRDATTGRALQARWP